MSKTLTTRVALTDMPQTYLIMVTLFFKDSALFHNLNCRGDFLERMTHAKEKFFIFSLREEGSEAHVIKKIRLHAAAASSVSEDSVKGFLSLSFMLLYRGGRET